MSRRRACGENCISNLGCGGASDKNVGRPRRLDRRPRRMPSEDHGLGGRQAPRGAGRRRVSIRRRLWAPLQPSNSSPRADMIGIPTLADAILDRVIHNAYRIDLAGESLRKPRSSPRRDAGRPLIHLFLRKPVDGPAGRPQQQKRKPSMGLEIKDSGANKPSWRRSPDCVSAPGRDPSPK